VLDGTGGLRHAFVDALTDFGPMNTDFDTLQSEIGNATASG
jgi:hypothetical protein